MGRKPEFLFRAIVQRNRVQNLHLGLKTFDIERFTLFLSEVCLCTSFAEIPSESKLKEVLLVHIICFLTSEQDDSTKPLIMGRKPEFLFRAIVQRNRVQNLRLGLKTFGIERFTLFLSEVCFCTSFAEIPSGSKLKDMEEIKVHGGDITLGITGKRIGFTQSRLFGFKV
jgi:hypothetical protein